MKLKALAILLLSAVGCLAQSPYNQSIYPAQSFTATAQTGSTIALNGATGSTGSSYGAGTITVTGTSVTTVTFAVMGSADGGVTFYALPITPLTAAGIPAATATATAAGLYQVSLVGITHIKLVTSGTFTAAGLTLTLTATPQVTLAGGASGGLGKPIDSLSPVGVSSVTFTNIPQNFKNLKIVGLFSSDAGSGNVAVQFNGDTGPNYDTQFLTGQTTQALASFVSAGAEAYTGNVSETGFVTTLEANIPGYSQSVLPTKSFNAENTSGGELNVMTRIASGGVWHNSSAITSITVLLLNGGNYSAGSTIELYGY